MTDQTPGPCEFNGNEIIEVDNPNKGVAGIAQDVPDTWGHVFAAGPEAFSLLKALVETVNKKELADAMLKAHDFIHRTNKRIGSLKQIDQPAETVDSDQIEELDKKDSWLWSTKDNPEMNDKIKASQTMYNVEHLAEKINEVIVVLNKRTNMEQE